MNLLQRSMALSMDPIDLIGDIHGHADELEALLKKMGYALVNGSYAHSARTVLFVGDYIDRGPKIRETLDIVRRMVESGNAIALMGNHEFNALCYHAQNGEGGYLREHTKKNVDQHQHTLDAFAGRPDELKDLLAWMLTLPLYYNTGLFRAVHACWDAQHIAYLRTRLENDRLTEELLRESSVKGSELHNAVEETLKGKEVKLPDGLSFLDKGRHKRHDLRIKWWVDPVGATYRELGFPLQDELPSHPVDVSSFGGRPHYFPDELPVFFGHYWLKHEPMLQRENICCLDYSVAEKGKLVAYRYDGEQRLDGGKLVFV
jgi:hypothetical protein